MVPTMRTNVLQEKEHLNLDNHINGKKNKFMTVCKIVAQQLL